MGTSSQKLKIKKNRSNLKVNIMQKKFSLERQILVFNLNLGNMTPLEKSASHGQVSCGPLKKGGH